MTDNFFLVKNSCRKKKKKEKEKLQSFSMLYCCCKQLRIAVVVVNAIYSDPNRRFAVAILSLWLMLILLLVAVIVVAVAVLLIQTMMTMVSEELLCKTPNFLVLWLTNARTQIVSTKTIRHFLTIFRGWADLEREDWSTSKEKKVFIRPII